MTDNVGEKLAWAQDPPSEQMSARSPREFNKAPLPSDEDDTDSETEFRQMSCMEEMYNVCDAVEKVRDKKHANFEKGPWDIYPSHTQFEIELGPTFKRQQREDEYLSKISNGELVNFYYDFRPQSIDGAKAILKYSSTGITNVQYSVPCNSTISELANDEISFKGQAQKAKPQDCLLIFDGTKFVLERVHTSIQKLTLEDQGTKAAAQSVESILNTKKLKTKRKYGGKINNPPLINDSVPTIDNHDGTLYKLADKVVKHENITDIAISEKTTTQENTAIGEQIEIGNSVPNKRIRKIAKKWEPECDADDNKKNPAQKSSFEQAFSERRGRGRGKGQK